MKTAISGILLFFTLLLQKDEPFSIDKLLETPKTYNGKQVEVKGYYSSQFESSALWISKKGFKKHDYKHSVWIGTFSPHIHFRDKNGRDTDLSYFQNKNIVATGTFKHTPDTIAGRIYGHGHMNIWPAELTDITLIEEPANE